MNRDCRFCGAPFEPSRHPKGGYTTQKLCGRCRALDSRARDQLARPTPPPDSPRCRTCGCLTEPALGGALPGEYGQCAPCTDWDRRRDERAARATRERARRPLYTFGPYAQTRRAGEGGSR